MNDSELDADLVLALAAARAAGEAALRYFRQHIEVHYKAPDQPVTIADTEANRVLQEMLIGARPDYGWLSEETADSEARLQRSRVWIVDPIDGTRSFVEGYPEFAISIGLVDDGEPRIGVVFNPATGELYHAVSGRGAYRDGAPLATAKGRGGSAPGVILASRSEIARGALDVFRPAWRIDPLGSTAYKMVKVADGTGDVYLSRGPKSEWDICAAALIVDEAGGQTTVLDGSELRYNRPSPYRRGILATNGSVHSRMLQEVARLSAEVPVPQTKEENR